MEEPYPSGTRVEKTKMGRNDAHKIGAKATVVSHFEVPDHVADQAKCRYAYFVEWDDVPGVPVLIFGRIAPLKLD